MKCKKLDDKDQFKTEILVKTEQIKKIQLWMHVCKQAHEFATDITRCIHWRLKAITEVKVQFY